jgi:predicted component of type VI protein secretion system
MTTPIDRCKQFLECDSVVPARHVREAFEMFESRIRELEAEVERRCPKDEVERILEQSMELTG